MESQDEASDCDFYYPTVLDRSIESNVPPTKREATKDFNTKVKQNLNIMEVNEICIDKACELFEKKHGDNTFYKQDSLMGIISELIKDSRDSMNIKYVSCKTRYLIYGFFRESHKELLLNTTIDCTLLYLILLCCPIDKRGIIIIMGTTTCYHANGI